jgi:hypothetical protein
LLKLGIDEIVADYVKLGVKLESEGFKVADQKNSLGEKSSAMLIQISKNRKIEV